jgi:hypothetical protein
VVDGQEHATPVPQQHMAILGNTGGGVRLQADTSSVPARALLIAGRPLHEPIVQYGPFVMNTRDELSQAIEDFRQGHMG